MILLSEVQVRERVRKMKINAAKGELNAFFGVGTSSIYNIISGYPSGRIPKYILDKLNMEEVIQYNNNRIVLPEESMLQLFKNEFEKSNLTATRFGDIYFISGSHTRSILTGHRKIPVRVAKQMGYKRVYFYKIKEPAHGIQA